LYGAFLAISSGLGLLDGLLTKKGGRPIHGTVPSMAKTVHMLGIVTLFVQIAVVITDSRELYTNAETGEEKVKILLDATHMIGLSLMGYFATYFSVLFIATFVASPIFIALLSMLAAYAVGYITSEPWFSIGNNRKYFYTKEIYSV